MVDIKSMSDEELEKIAGSEVDLKSIPDEQLRAIANQPYGLEDLGKAATSEFSGIGQIKDIAKMLPQTKASDVGKELMRGVESGEIALPSLSTIGKFAKGAVRPYTNPIESFKEAPVSTSLAYTPLLSIAKLLKSGLASTAKGVGETMETSRLVPTTLQHGTLESSAKIPEVRKIFREGFAPENVEKIEANFESSLDNTQKRLKEIGRELYDKPEIRDAKVDLLKEAKIEDNQGNIKEAIQPMVKINNAITDFSSTASSFEKPVITQANEYMAMILKDAKEGQLNLTQAHKWTNKFDSLENSATDYSQKKLWGEMRRSIQAAKNNTLELAEAGGKYKDLMKAKELMDDILRLSADSSEITAAKKVIRRYKEQSNVRFNQKVDELGEILSKNPESKDLANFSKDIKILQAVTDVSKAKSLEVSVPILSKIPLVGQFLKGKISPATQAQLASFVNPERMLGRTRLTTTPFIGRGISKTRSIMDLMPKVTPDMPTIPSLPMTTKTMSIINILNSGRKKDEENSFLNR